jgi:copper chaperone NosL
MKKILPFLTIVVIIAIIIIIFLSMSNAKQMVVLKEGNTSQIPLEIILGKYQDSDCGMTIDKMDYVSQVIAPDGKTWFFHDHGGMAHWLEDKPFKDSAKVWVMSKDTKKYIDGRSAWYSRTETTPMGYGFGAYENKQDGFITFDEMTLKMLRNESLKNPYIKKELLGNNGSN